MDKKSIVLIILISAILVSVTNSQLTSATNYSTDYFMDVLKSFFYSFGEMFFEDSDFLFEKFLFLAITLSVIYASLSKVNLFNDKPAVHWVTSICVALLATRFLADTEMVEFILNPYSILGVTLLSIVPFIIYFVFINGFEESIIRKVGWSLYTIVFFGLWYSSFEELGNIAYIYFFTAVLSFILILSDKYVRGMYLRSSIQKGLDKSKFEALLDLKDKIDKNYQRLNKASGDERRELLKLIGEQQKTYKEMSRV